MRVPRAFLNALLAAAISTIALASHAFADDVKVTFVLTSDIYEMDEVRGSGGFPRLATAIKQEREMNPNTIVVNAGDLISPSLLSGLNQGEHMIELTNLIGTDVFVPGNHEFDFGKEVAMQRMAESNFPWIAANMTEANGSPVAGIEATLVKEVDGVKIGFIGLAEEGTTELSSPGDLKFLPAVVTARVKADELRAGGADFVVAINHNSRAIGNEMDGAVDMVANGHTHNFHLSYNGRTVAGESQSDANLIAVIEINFSVTEDDGKRRVTWKPDFRVYDSANLEPDADMAAKVAEYAKILDDELNVEIGATAVELDSRRASVRSMETMMGNLVADGMRTAVGADIAITNGGGIRGDKVYPADTVLTRRDILTELPFGNKTIMLQLSGAQVKEALENGASQIEDSAGRFPQVSGLTFTIDKSQPPGSRVSDIAVNGQPIDLAASYKVATNDYMARGGDGYSVFTAGELLVNPESAKLMANDVMAYIRSMGGVKGSEAPRITVK
jgi:5'-nucleotidase / UDP-sugar diphosphatase